VSLICCFHTERGKACPDMAATGGERECSKQHDLQGIEYRRGGAPADRLVVAVKSLPGAVGAERRGRIICGWLGESTGVVPGRN
jgi:hypothetical protein